MEICEFILVTIGISSTKRRPRRCTCLMGHLPSLDFRNKRCTCICALTDHPMTGYEVNRLFLKKHRIFIGPSTIYSKLATMEREAWIKCVRNRAGRVCSLTEKGRKITADMTGITREIQDFIRTILKSQDYTPPEQ
jgi:hypothetical protein